MKLKTLKDLGDQLHVYPKYMYGDKEIAFHEDLKAEAVKWINSITFRREDEGWTLQHCDWIQHFFNIADSDLKEAKNE